MELLSLMKCKLATTCIPVRVQINKTDVTQKIISDLWNPNDSVSEGLTFVKIIDIIDISYPRNSDNKKADCERTHKL